MGWDGEETCKPGAGVWTKTASEQNDNYGKIHITVFGSTYKSSQQLCNNCLKFKHHGKLCYEQLLAMQTLSFSTIFGYPVTRVHTHMHSLPEYSGMY